MRITIKDRTSATEWISSRNHVMTVYRDIHGDDTGTNLFPLRYVRAGYESDVPPIMVLPGGPGIASVFPYELLRRQLANKGLDVVMMEHRGVGMSRTDARGDDLPLSAMHVDLVLDDMLAVLDHARIDRVVLYGSSYGAHLAQRFALAHPDRVHALVLDSPYTSVADEEAHQSAVRDLYWNGSDPRTQSTAAALRRLVAQGVVDPEESGPVIAAVHEYGGPRAVRELAVLLAVGRGQLTWASINQVITGAENFDVTPFAIERDLVGRIGATELGVGSRADGQPMDATYLDGQRAKDYDPFSRPELDLERERARIIAPTLVLAGERDLITTPERSRLAAEQIPGARFVLVNGVGHSLLDAHTQLAVYAAWWAAAGQIDAFAERDHAEFRRRTVNSVIAGGIRVALLAERHSPVKLWAGRSRLSAGRFASADARGTTARRGRSA